MASSLQKKVRSETSTAAPRDSSARRVAREQFYQPGQTAKSAPGSLRISPDEVELGAVRAQGAGGQNVNKVSNAAHLRFDVKASSLPEAVRARLLALKDQRISKDGVVIIKAQRFRSLEKNRAEALERLQALVDAAAQVPARRRATQPTRAAVTRRLDSKARRARTKANRSKVPA